jgi:hypothetical protein
MDDTDDDDDDDCKRAAQARRGSPYLIPKEAARYLRVKPQTLAKMRVQKRGPKYERRGRFIRYHIAELDTWLKANPQ